MAGQGDHCEYRARPGQADPTGAPDPGAPRATHPRAAAGPGDEAARDPRARALARREPRHGRRGVRGARRRRLGARPRRPGHVRHRESRRPGRLAAPPPLRRCLPTYLLRFGLEARPEEILIVNGSQQGFDLIARTLIDQGDTVAIEQPTYPRALQVFRSFGAQLAPVPWDAVGPRVEVFERLLERHAPKLFYCQPSAHNPTGLTLLPETGRRLLEVAVRHHVPIVEDGFDGSLYYGARPAVPLKAADVHGVVIYIGTFSKILFPGLRLGWIVGAPPILERLQAAKQLADLHTSALIQAAVHRFCERRLLDRHAARVAREYARRRALLLAALERRMPAEVTWTEPQGGFSLLLTLPPGLDATELLPAAIERGVAFTPGAPFFMDGAGAGTPRLSFSSVAAARYHQGVPRLVGQTNATSTRHTGGTRLEPATVPVV